MKRTGSLGSLFAILLLFGCGKDVVAPDDSTNSGETPGNVGGTPGSAEECEDPNASDECDAESLFSRNAIPVFDLRLPAAEWEALKLNARDEEYVEAELAFEGATVGTVGLRFKGAFGTLEACFDESGALLCKKLSMKLSFDEYTEDQRFFGLKKLNLHSMIHDASHLHERIAYGVYRKMGVPAPRSAWAVVRVNGETQGLYSMVEQIDGRFTKDRWPGSGDGNLYKEAVFSWQPASDFAGAPVDVSQAYATAIAPFGTKDYYTAHLETNKTDGDTSRLAAFATALAGASAGERRNVLGQYMDLDAVATYLAVDDAVFNWDGITAVYTGADFSWSGSHNYYLYENPTTERVELVAWDMDGAMDPSNGFGAVPHWTETPVDCAQLHAVFGGSSHVLAPGCSPFFQAMAADLDAYRESVAALLAGPFSEEALLEQIEKDKPVLEAAVLADPLGPTVTTWKHAVEKLEADLPVLRARLESLAKGEGTHPFVLETTEANDFDALTSVDLVLGSSLASNANSTARTSVEKTSPLGGSQSMRLDFRYDDETTPWGQWLEFRLGLQEGSVDATKWNGIRLRLRADGPRTLRLNLESPAQTAGNQGIRDGWDIAVSETGAVVEVLFADARVPSWAVAQGKDPGDDLALVLSTVTNLSFHPYCVGRDTSGFLPGDATDTGWLLIDDLEFF